MRKRPVIAFCVSECRKQSAQMRRSLTLTHSFIQKNVFSTYYILEGYMKKRKPNKVLALKTLECVKCYERHHFGSTEESMLGRKKNRHLPGKKGEEREQCSQSQRLALCNTNRRRKDTQNGWNQGFRSEGHRAGVRWSSVLETTSLALHPVNT